MRTLFVAVLLAGVAPPAWSDAARGARSELEAHSYLSDCAALSSSMRPACARVQADFVHQYRRAMSGNGWAQQDVAAWLMRGGVGLPKNPVQGCAWALIATRNNAEAQSGARVWCAQAGQSILQPAMQAAMSIAAGFGADGVHQRQGGPKTDPEDD